MARIFGGTAAARTPHAHAPGRGAPGIVTAGTGQLPTIIVRPVPIEIERVPLADIYTHPTIVRPGTYGLRHLDGLAAFAADACPAGHPRAAHGFVDHAGTVRCRVCTRDKVRRSRRRKAGVR